VEKKDSGYLRITIVVIKMSIVLHHLELPSIFISRKLKNKKPRKVDYYSSTHQSIPFPNCGWHELAASCGVTSKEVQQEKWLWKQSHDMCHKV
jgi:hypothetical protein